MRHAYLTSRAFQSLTLLDLLEARDRHHVRLATQYDNVVGTAVGFFRYRPGDDGYENEEAGAAGPQPARLATLDTATIARRHAPRTMENSVVRRWSPPCILVFVDRWLEPEEFRTMPEKVLPSFLETDDARLVPTCIVLAEKDESLPDPSTHLSFPRNLYGGGYVAVTDVQERERVGSVACLVTDGDLVYALTNRHVTGAAAGRPIYTYVGGVRTRIGESASRNVGKVPSSTVYRKWPGQEAYANVDTGLILVDDVHRWTTQVYGIGQLDEPFRINFDAALETCIGLRVRAFGAASGPLSGEIAGLFYRYKTLGGYDFIADFLIGPRPGEADQMCTLPGDSGTLWVIDPPVESPPAAGTPDAGWYQPVAVQWGGQVMVGAGGSRKFRFALATSVESVCRLLEVDVVRDWNLGHPEYWGEMGHYTIGLKACGLVTGASPRLRELLTLNSAAIGFDDTILRDPARYHKHKAGYKNVPLADVPDDVWRTPGEYGRTGAPGDPDANDDSNNHFADMDEPGVGKYKGRTLMSMYVDDPATLSVDTWLEFYSLLEKSGKRVKAGALPFRVWQAFDEMVRYLRDGNVAGYFCVAGIVAHYVGDTSQPLHISRFHHGPPGSKKDSVAFDIHEVYETLMLDRHTDKVLDGLNTRLDAADAASHPDMKTGEDAARRVVELMIATYRRLPPETIISRYVGSSQEERADNLWESCKEETLDNMAACCRFLASLWESAWIAAGAEETIDPKEIRTFDYDELRDIYRPESFFRSVALSRMKPLLS